MADGDRTPAASGVEALVERLREEGVAAGRQQAQAIVADAERRADWLVRQAQEEAERLRNQAREEAERFRRAGEDALRVAARDGVLELSAALGRSFAEQVHWLVSHQLRDDDFLRRLIIEVAGRARPQLEAAARVEVLLPREVVGLDELRRRPEELKEGSLSHFVLAVAGQVLRDGVSFTVSDQPGRGIQIRLVEEDVEIDLSDRTVADLLLRHLQPRFRAILEGVVR